MPNIRTKSEHLEALLVYFLYVCISLACIARVHTIATEVGGGRGWVKDYFSQMGGN